MPNIATIKHRLLVLCIKTLLASASVDVYRADNMFYHLHCALIPLPLVIHLASCNGTRGVQERVAGRSLPGGPLGLAGKQSPHLSCYTFNQLQWVQQNGTSWIEAWMTNPLKKILSEVTHSYARHSLRTLPCNHLQGSQSLSYNTPHTHTQFQHKSPPSIPCSGPMPCTPARRTSLWFLKPS